MEKKKVTNWQQKAKIIPAIVGVLEQLKKKVGKSVNNKF